MKRLPTSGFVVLPLLFLSQLVASSSAADRADPAAIADLVNRHLAARWKSLDAQPVPPAGDAVFVRRVHLDLIGRIPTVAEVREHLADPAPDKRTKLVTRLVGSAAYARHWATFWRREWIPQADMPQSTLPDEIDGWLEARIRDNVPYDRIVRDLLTASPTGWSRRDGHERSPNAAAPSTFLAASEHKPENLAANMSRAFLGINLDCAQCHNHPFARWTRDQFWETAAFFVRPSPAAEGGPLRLELRIVDTEKSVAPRFLTGALFSRPERLERDTGRIALADWVTAKENPYFARNAVNRVWSALFGTGLIEPLDDLGGENSASHSELLDDLATEFSSGGGDLKSLISALVLTRAYGLAATGSPEDLSTEHRETEQSDAVVPQLYAQFPVRGLTGEQLYDSLRVAGGLPVEQAGQDPVDSQRARRRFAQSFRVERTGAVQRSILQSLALMNGSLTRELTDPEETPMLRGIADSPFLDMAGKVETLYLAALGRPPAADEAAPLVNYVASGGPDRDSQKALADIFWVLLNSSEFGTNH